MVFGSKGASEDPYYNRKPVPDEFIKDVGVTGLTQQEEFANRERKFSVDGVDVRKFSNSRNSGMEPQDDPYYGRRRVSNAETHGVAHSGLSAEEEYANRERKLSVNGVDLRKFGNSSKSGFHPSDDPYYGRKKVDGTQTQGIGETGNTHATDYETRERKQSVVNFSSDPFQQVAGTGHRQSISGGHVSGAAAAATERRRSSAVAPDAAAAAATARHGSGHGHGHTSGYSGDDRLAPIQSRTEGGNVLDSNTGVFGGGSATGGSGLGSNGVAGSSGHNYTNNNNGVGTEHTEFYDNVTTGHDHLRPQGQQGHPLQQNQHQQNPLHQHRPQQDVYDDPDSVAPNEVR